MSDPGRLLYLANVRIPSEKAHVYQIFQMCDAFAARGAAVRLIYPRRANLDELRDVGDPAAFYGIRRPPALVALPCLDPVKLVTIDLPGSGEDAAQSGSVCRPNGELCAGRYGLCAS